VESRRVIELELARYEQQQANDEAGGSKKLKRKLRDETGTPKTQRKKVCEPEASKTQRRSKGDEASKKPKKVFKISDEDEDDDDEEDDDEDNGDDDVDDDEDNGKSSKPKKRRQYSKFWNDFIVIKKVNHLGKSEERAICKHCKSDYAYNAHKNGKNTYRRYLQICKLVPRNGDVSKMMVNAEAKLQARKIDQSVFRELVAKTIIQHDLPFSYVEYERVRDTWRYLKADVKFFSRNTAVADVYKFYETDTDKLKRELVQLSGRISLTTYLWSTLTPEGYMCLTAHYIDRNWKLNNKILVFCAFPPPYT